LFDPLLPWIDVVWMTGVTLLSLRCTLGWVFLQKLAGLHLPVLEIETRARFQMLLSRMHITVPVRLVQSALVEVPMVIGWWRPLILLPASTLVGLPPEELEAILAHELAHVARHDFLLNLLQTIVETLFFYHPAVWWIGRKLREERENCCDDLAVAVIGNRYIYVKALARLEESRATGPGLAVAATGPTLLLRIRRLAGVKPKNGLVLPGGVLLVVMVLGIASLLPSQTVTPTKTPTPASREGIVAMVNGHPILEKDVDRAMNQSINNAEQTLTGDALKQRIAELRKDTLQDVIDQELMLETFAAQGGKIPKDFVDERVKQTVTGSPYNGDEAAFNKALADRGISIDQYRQDIATTAIVFYLKERHSYSIADDFYQNHPDLFPMDERLNLTILNCFYGENPSPAVKDRYLTLARQIQQEAKGGAELNSLATKYKQEKVTIRTRWFTQDGGDWLVTRGWSAIDKLQPGQISDVFESNDEESYYIVRMNERRPAQVVLPPEMKDQKKVLLQAIRDTNLKTWLDDLRAGAHIQIF
jgi:Zn-dependent protease with chaperone function